jgi:hypothetical protein
MLCRKALMVCAVAEGAADGAHFVTYVDYIATNILSFPKARSAIDAIRSIGNDANHDVAFVTEADANRSMVIVRYMLDTIYSFPAA